MGLQQFADARCPLRHFPLGHHGLLLSLQQWRAQIFHDQAVEAAHTASTFGDQE